MSKRILAAIAATVMATALLAGCSAGGTTVAVSKAPTAAAVPSVVAISPAAGSLVGGEKVTVTGRGLGKVTRATFGTQAATGVTVVNSTTVTAIVPRAVNYQPTSGSVALFAGATPIASAKAPTYTWAVETGVDRQMQYAFAHWNAKTYNTAYYDFNAVGGDCQNFVSQSLLARGFKQSSDWFYTSASSHSESWGYAPTFDDYLEGHPELGFTKLTDAQRSQLSVGDLAYFDWNHNGVPDHTMIVSGVSTVNGKTTVTLVGHNLDSDYRDLDTAITKDHPGATVWFWKVPAKL